MEKKQENFSQISTGGNLHIPDQNALDSFINNENFNQLMDNPLQQQVLDQFLKCDSDKCTDLEKVPTPDFELLDNIMVNTNYEQLMNNPLQQQVLDQFLQHGGSVTNSDLQRIDIIDQSQSVVEKYNLDKHIINFKIKNTPQHTPVETWIEEAFLEVWNLIHQHTDNPRDRIIMSFKTSTMNSEAHTHLSPINNFTFGRLWEIVSSICQSNDPVMGNDLFTIDLTVLKSTVGGSSVVYTNNNNKTFARGALRLRRDDMDLCLPRSIVTCLNIVCGKKKKQKTQVANASEGLDFCQKAKIIVPIGGCGLTEINLFQDFLINECVALVVWSFDINDCHKLFFDGKKTLLNRGVPRENMKIINIVYYPNEKHFEPIKYMHVFIGRDLRFWCDWCARGYHKKDYHKLCWTKCKRCLSYPACIDYDLEKCLICNRLFYSGQCFENHLRAGSYSKNYTVCDRVRKCGICKKVYLHENNHKCGLYYCASCQDCKKPGHLCYMSPNPKNIKNRKDGKVNGFLFFDFETRTELKPYKKNTQLKIHVVNYFCAQLVCEICANSDNDQNCFCGETREFSHQGDDAMEIFVDIVLKSRYKYAKLISIAHNGGGYDSQFVLRELVKRTPISNIQTIVKGTRLTLISFSNVKFIDSLNYFFMPLSALPKAFGIKELTKGYFPFFFNKVEHQNYVGPLPPKEDFGVCAMTQEKQEEFDKWYAERLRGPPFDFKKEMAYYCRSDVELLKQACITYRKLMMQVGNVCPFTEALTAASTSLLIYRRNYLKENDIGIIPKNGYRLADNQSTIAIQWLLWLEHAQGVKLKHAGRGREQRVSGYLVDGISEDGKIIYFFHGCYYHGCDCFESIKNFDADLGDNTTLRSRRENTEYINTHLQRLGYEIVIMWECEFRRMCINNLELKNFLKTINYDFYKEKICPRDALFGGRTENFCVSHTVTGSEKIMYKDVCSLYPFVLKTKVFPLGHPEVYVLDEISKLCPNNNINNVIGLIKCKVLPPNDLYFPVLPVRCHNKLFFPLCHTCTVTLNQNNCTHNDTERMLSGTWVSEELKVAVEKGYNIVEIKEIWHWTKTTKYDPETREGGLFTGYINAFLKIKQEASGWPSECVDDASKQAYIDNYSKVEGIDLDPTKIKKNPGLRQVSKNNLNSLWGRLAMDNISDMYSIIQNIIDFNEIVENPNITVSCITIIDDETLFINWKYTDNCDRTDSSTNPVLGAFTTAHARLELYKYLDQTQEAALYVDTDSIVYRSRDVSDRLPVGNYLGELTDELDGGYITTFISGGPKFYSYILKNTDGTESKVCKLKGVKLNVNAQKLINHKTSL